MRVNAVVGIAPRNKLACFRIIFLDTVDNDVPVAPEHSDIARHQFLCRKRLGIYQTTHRQCGFHGTGHNGVGLKPHETRHQRRTQRKSQNDAEQSRTEKRAKERYTRNRRRRRSTPREKSSGTCADARDELDMWAVDSLISDILRWFLSVFSF